MSQAKIQVFNKVAKESSLSFLITLFRFSLVYLINIVIPLGWGTETLGNFVYYESILMLLVPFTIIGMDRALVKYLNLGTQTEIDTYTQVSNSSFFSLLLNILILAGLFIVALFTSLLKVHAEMLHWFMLFLLALIPYSLIMIFKGGLEGLKLNSVGIFIREFLFRAVFLLALLVFLVLGISQEAIFISYPIIMSITSLIMIAVFLKRSGSKLSLPSVNLSGFVASNFFKYSLTMIGVTLVAMLHFRLDRVMLGLLGDRADLGEYHLIALFCGSVAIFLRASNSISGPFFSKLFSDGDLVQLKEFYRIITKWTFIGILPGVLVLLIYSKRLIDLALGAEYLYLQSVFIVLMLAHFVSTFLGPANNFMAMTGQEKRLFHINVIFAILSIGVMYLGIIQLGMLGAAIGTAFYIIFQKLTSFYFSYRKFSIGLIDRDYLYVALLLIVFAMVSYWVPDANLSSLIIKMGGSIVFGYLYCAFILLRSKNTYDQMIIGIIKDKMQTLKNRLS